MAMTLQEFFIGQSVYAQGVPFVLQNNVTSCSQYGQSFYQKHQNQNDTVESCYCYKNTTYTIA